MPNRDTPLPYQPPLRGHHFQGPLNTLGHATNSELVRGGQKADREVAHKGPVRKGKNARHPLDKSAANAPKRRRYGGEFWRSLRRLSVGQINYN